MWDNPFKMFVKYVIPSVLGMVGISAYVLADTFFISVANGADGIATLNIVLPIYSIIFAIGSMIGVGAATRFALYSSMKDQRAEKYFMNSILFATLFGLLFMLAGFFFPEMIIKFVGGDKTVIRLGVPYLRIVLIFAPFFMLNYVLNAFTRNDGAPERAMLATLTSSIFNIIFDYILMFPLKMGMTGAALATALSPVVGCIICLTHILSKKSTLKFPWCLPSVRVLVHSCQLGIPAFIGEFASGITTFVFNMLILGITGNNGIAAYGVIANISIVVIAIFNGISQGGQPLFSHYFGKGDKKSLHIVLKYTVYLSLIVSILVIIAANAFPHPIVSIFNSGGNSVMQELAVTGIRIYFTGMFFAGINIAATGYLGAIGDSVRSTVISVLRGIILIIAVAVLLSYVWKMNGVWAAFPVSEALVMAISIIVLFRNKNMS